MFMGSTTDYKSFQIAARLLATGINPNPRSVDGMTPLHFAAREGRQGAVVSLLLGGADRSIQDQYGMTALQYATRRGHRAVIDYLLKIFPSSRLDSLKDKCRLSLWRHGNLPATWQEHAVPVELVVLVSNIDDLFCLQDDPRAVHD